MNDTAKPNEMVQHHHCDSDLTGFVLRYTTFYHKRHLPTYPKMGVITKKGHNSNLRLTRDFHLRRKRGPRGEQRGGSEGGAPTLRPRCVCQY